jgi:hypothetical protein
MIDTEKTSPFVLRMPANFWWTVRIPVPGDNSYTLATLDMLFKPLPQAEIDKFQGIGLEEGDAIPSEEQICRRVVAGWRNLADEEGVVHPFSAEALGALLAVPVVRSAIVVTYLTVMRGVAARKNG